MTERQDANSQSTGKTHPFPILRRELFSSAKEIHLEVWKHFFLYFHFSFVMSGN